MNTTTTPTAEQLLEMLANATNTYYCCGGHNKAEMNERRATEYREQLVELGVDIPSDRELCEKGEFNGIGSY